MTAPQNGNGMIPDVECLNIARLPFTGNGCPRPGCYGDQGMTEGVSPHGLMWVSSLGLEYHIATQIEGDVEAVHKV